MDRLTTVPLRIGAWRVDPATGQLSRDGETVRLEARTLRLLLCLANRAGEVVSIDELLDQVWSGVVVTPDSVYQAVTALRRLLGDDAKQPTYIATVPRLGYRMVAPVGTWIDEPIVPAAAPAQRPRRRAAFAVAAACLALAAAAMWLGNSATDGKSVAVLPFLDLTTQAMNEEYFADGMTEAIIDRLAKVPGLRVPAPTDSFFYKNKQLPMAEIASALRVAYLLDGSLRESGDVLRVAVRLVRAKDGFVVWSETFDRPKADRLKLQDEIASEVVRALKVSIN